MSNLSPLTASDNTHVNCNHSCNDGLETMFVDMVQKGRIEAGQCPALRPVFHKVHGVLKGQLVIRKDIDPILKVGVFTGKEYPILMRISSDTSPQRTGFKSTVGIGLKLFNVPGQKLIDDPDDITFDFIFQNHPVFFLDTAKDMCEFTKAALIDNTVDDYLENHPKTAKILDEMARSLGSVLASEYWTILPSALGKYNHVKFKLIPHIIAVAPDEAPADLDYLARDLEKRMRLNGAKFTLCAQLRTHPEKMPLDQASVLWSELESPFIPVADLILPLQDLTDAEQQAIGENFACNIWRVTQDHKPQGSLADARRQVYRASARLRRTTNNVIDQELKRYPQ